MLRLKELRTSLNLNQLELATKVGLSRSAYANIENGNRAISSELLSELAELFSVSMDYLYGKNVDASSPTSIAVSHDEIDLINTFRSLNTQGRHALLTSSQIILGNPSMLKNT